MATIDTASPRRILGEKAVNTSNVPAQVSSDKDSLWPSRLGSTQRVASNKRRIDEVDMPEEAPMYHRPRNEPLQRGNVRIYEDASQQYQPGMMGPSTDANETDSQKSSLSSLINFDAEDETMCSQQTEATELTQPERSTASIHAENLRLRLRVAMFKVQTNQESIPMSQLQISPKKSELSPPTLSLPLSNNSSQDSQASLLLPAPVFQPVAFSSRMIPQTCSAPSPSGSSNDSSQASIQRSNCPTPALLRQTLHHVQQESGISENIGTKNHELEQESVSDSPSSIVTGRAASGLLGLMHAL